MSGLQLYKQLVTTLKDEEIRETISSSTLQQLVVDLNNLSKEMKKENATMEEHYHSVQAILECLRNSCISCQRNQLILINKSSPVEAILKILQDDHIMKCGEDNIEITKIKKLSLQFLGNLIVGNKVCQDAVRQMVFPKIVLELLDALPESLGEIVCMIIYNFVSERSEMWDSKESIELLAKIISFVENSDSEWGLLILECILKDGKFADLYNHLSGYHRQRMVFLDLLQAFINDDKCIVPENVITFISDEYRETFNVIRTVASIDDKKMEELADLAQALLKILCSAASAQNYKKIASDATLLDSVVNQLIELSMRTKEHRDTDAAGSFRGEGVIGFKRDLVRLIGNLSYNNKKFQDRVRELGGISPILDNCRIDDTNPYISQWAVFAIRNLCENNVENQRLISSLDQRGLADNTYISQLGFDLRMADGKIGMSYKTNERQ